MTKQKKNAYHFGLFAESYAAFFLRLKGYKILAERHRNPKGEIDLLAMKGNMLIAVEVKARKDFSGAAESITPFKQKKIIGALEWVLAGRGPLAKIQKHGIDFDIRFDVVLVVPWRLPKHIKDAWRG